MIIQFNLRFAPIWLMLCLKNFALVFAGYG